jgi:hypothetical protein
MNAVKDFLVLIACLLAPFILSSPDFFAVINVI